MNTPCPKEIIDKLKRIQLKENESKKNCPICFEEYKLEDTLIELNCNHDYHEKCIISWLSLNDLCPYCKKKVE